MRGRDPAFLRFYGIALLLLPRRFRRQHGVAMEAMLRDEWHERKRGGRILLAQISMPSRVGWRATRTRGVRRFHGWMEKRCSGSTRNRMSDPGRSFARFTEG